MGVKISYGVIFTKLTTQLIIHSQVEGLCTLLVINTRNDKNVKIAQWNVIKERLWAMTFLAHLSLRILHDYK